MLCSGHQGSAGPLTCSGCGITGCQGCFEQVGDFLYCTNCLLERLEGTETQLQEEQITAEIQDVQGAAKRRIKRNWVLTFLFSLVGVPGAFSSVTSDATLSPSAKTFVSPLAALAVVYLIWASLWGVAAAWAWWTRLFSNTNGIFVFDSGLGWLILAVGFFVIPLEFGSIYGVFGGAFYEYRKTRMIAHGVVS